MTKQKILMKVMDKEFEKRCLAAGVCYKCGGDLCCIEVWEDGGIDKVCKECGTKYTI
jgi:hypothetical protein